MTAPNPSMRRVAARRRPAGPHARLAAIAAAACLGLIALPRPAPAQTIVVGNSLAEACYRRALFADITPDAMADCDRALKQATSRRNIAATHINRAILRIHRRDYDGALEDVDDSVRFHRFAEANSTRGAVYFHMGRLAESVEQYTIGLDSGELTEPHKAYYNRGLAQEAMERIEAAYNDYLTAAELAPDWDRPQAELARFVVTAPGGGAS